MALQGIVLFAFVPLVLFLFLRQPLGPGWSVALALGVMAGHRVVALPWVAKHADVRCLWCGRLTTAHHLVVHAAGRRWTMAVCSEQHARATARFVALVERGLVPIAFGILVPLTLLVACAAAEAVSHPVLPREVAALQFRAVVALTVVVVSLAAVAWPSPPSETRLTCPFPIHTLALLGIGRTLWVFRLVGAWWLIDVAVRLLS